MRKWATGDKPDLVDRAEIGERLGVNAATVSRWHRRSILPEPDRRLGPLEIWNWGTIGEWAKDRSRFAKNDRRREMPDLVDLAGIADRLELNQQIIENWYRNQRLPAPDYRWAAGDVWLWDTIDTWQQTQLAGRSIGLPTRGEGSLSPPSRPSGPKLQIPGRPAEPAPATAEVGPPSEPRPVPTAPGIFATADSPVEIPPPVDHRQADAPVRAVASPVESPIVAPEAVDVTLAPRERSSDPIGDIERLGAYFSKVAKTLSVA
ncbi:MAG: hypothetical protein OER12_07780 [Acidimicrobiia bacterium]|nr:hypothetical protein [Acidimicrobiia bacterium]